MRYLKTILLLAVFCTGAANADVWKWVDPNGKTHFVDSNKAIYVWRDDTGRVFYSDKKDHDDAVLVQLIWHSSGSLQDMEEENSGSGSDYDEEARREQMAYEAEKKKACKRAQEIYDSYLNAPRLYRNSDDGEKVYLSDKEAKEEIALTKSKVDEVCS